MRRPRPAQHADGALARGQRRGLDLRQESAELADDIGALEAWLKRPKVAWLPMTARARHQLRDCSLTPSSGVSAAPCDRCSNWACRHRRLAPDSLRGDRDQSAEDEHDRKSADRAALLEATPERGLGGVWILLLGNQVVRIAARLDHPLVSTQLPDECEQSPGLLATPLWPSGRGFGLPGYLRRSGPPAPSTCAQAR